MAGWGLSVGPAAARDNECLPLYWERDTTAWRIAVTLPSLWSFAAQPLSMPHWQAELLCPTETLSLIPTSTQIASPQSWEFLFCLDRSARTTLPSMLLRHAVAVALSCLREEDRLVLIQYHYQAEFITAISGNTAHSIRPDTFSVVPPRGLAAPLHIVQAALEYCRLTPSPRRRAILLLTEAPDEASFLVRAHDVTQTARQLRIPLVILHVGLLSNRAFWQGLATECGGAYYWVPTVDNHLPQLLGQLIRGLQRHYIIRFPSPPHKCSPLRLRFRSEPLAAATDYQYVELPPEVLEPRRTICYFAEADTSVGSEFLPLLMDLARWLRSRPGEVIELLGHTSEAEEATYGSALGLRRAQALRRRLLQLGVAPQQLRLRTVGAQQPLSYFERTPQQQLVNRRVELRWLRPDYLPYELIVATVPSEAKALQLVELWEDRGYRAYLELVRYRGKPMYQVKLWGFPTLEAANQARLAIQQRYRVAVRLW
ncbi:MAG: OmpA family protein [Candidatus Kapabacteria bacterium]|nr:OmpA family protein [Candidatus Kapabacteria bacterium]MDW8012864.1 OmpA family protein [Bacteroidota bacterium]